MPTKTMIRKKSSELMPSDPAILAILHQRAVLIARHEDIKTEVEANSYIHFSISDKDHYGIPYEYAKEIIHNVNLTSVPKSPVYIAGLINWRGMLVTVVDIGVFFHLRDKVHELDTNCFVIVVEHKGLTLGILVDRLEGSESYQASVLDKPLSCAANIKSDYVVGLHRGRVAIINVESVLTELTKS